MILSKTSQCMKLKVSLEKLPTYFANYAIDRDKKMPFGTIQYHDW